MKTDYLSMKKSDYKTAKRAPEEKNRVMALLSGVLIAFAITCMFFIGCALGLTYASLSEEAVSTVMLVAVAVSVVVAGYDAAKGALKNGWLWGMAAGFIYAAVLICAETWVGGSFMVDSKTVTSVALSVAGGCFGGVIGINFRKK